jgi:Chaperone of endosialidase
MRHLLVIPAFFIALLVSPIAAIAQAQDQSASIPRLITITGVYRPADGTPSAAVETVTLSVYAEQQGGAPLFQETQQVTLDDRGRYTVVLGAAHADGIPPAIFATGAQWLGTVFERPGEVEGARVRLTSVPYAMRAAEADSLGGHPASDYVLASGAAADSKTGSAASDATRSDIAGPTGTANFLAKYVDSVNFGNSALYETAGQIGLGTTTPYDMFHVRFTNTGGTFTGLTVQNLGNTATSYSGMLFYDQNDQLGQFQGFNNVTHEYRINNVARVSPGGAFNGSINFMTGNTSRFVVAQNGNVGIGTTAPSALLEVSNAVPGGPANMWMTSYTNAIGPYYMARRARGTPGAPTAVQSGDGLSGLFGEGYGATAFGSGFAGGMTVQAAQNWTDTAHGTQIAFSTTANNSTTSGTRMLIANSGMVGIGTTTPVSNLEVSNALSGTTFGVVTATSFGNTTGASLFMASKARGTSAAPTAVLAGDSLGGFLARGFFTGATTGFSGTRGGMFVTASENWTDTAQGTKLFFNTTTNGTTAPGTRMTIDSAGNVGIGTTNPITTLEIVRNGETNFIGTSYNNDDGSAVFFQRARGTAQTPAAVLAGDALGYFGAGGYGATTFGDGVGVMAVVAAENWTDTANGSTIAFATTPLGTTDFVPQAAILSNGFLGLGTPGDANGIPTATDRLQVFGDIRVGTTGTNGCLKRFDGTALAGTCSSDRRFKKEITPFAPVLGQLTALQPVHYYWRAEDFPNRHFGTAQSYGLIAQEVEQVLPELVTTDSDGYKAVDYTKLPLLTIQAVKELKAENDELKKQVSALKQQVENDPLKQRVAELERLIEELLALKK